MTTLKECSKESYTAPSSGATHKDINTGSLQRIADATEKMCLDREKLERDYKYMRESRGRLHNRTMRLERQLSATKGVVTKLKNKLAGI